MYRRSISGGGRFAAFRMTSRAKSSTLTSRIAALTTSEARSMPRSRAACSITSGSGSSAGTIGTPSAVSRAIRSCSVKSCLPLTLSPEHGTSAQPSLAARRYMLQPLPAIQLRPLSMLGPQGAQNRIARRRCVRADDGGSCSYSSSYVTKPAWRRASRCANPCPRGKVWHECRHACVFVGT